MAFSLEQARRHGDWGHSAAVQITAHPPPPNEYCASQTRIVPKESNRLGATGVQFEAWDPQNYWSSPPEFMRKNRSFADSAMETFFLASTLEFEGTKFLCNPKKCLCPPPQLRYSGAGPGLEVIGIGYFCLFPIVK